VEEQDRKETDNDDDLMQVQRIQYTGSRQTDPLISSFISCIHYSHFFTILRHFNSRSINARVAPLLEMTCRYWHPQGIDYLRAYWIVL